MRRLALALTVCAPLACQINLNDGDGGSGETTANDSAVSAGPSTSNATTAPGDSTQSSDPGTSSQGTASATTDDPGDSSSGEMSGCEGGPLPAPIPGCTPIAAASTGDFGQDCVDRINQFRWECQCLPPLARWADAETCTDDQCAADQSSGAAHGNFGVCGEYAQNTCPNWGSEQDVVVGCLQAMWDEGPGEPFSAHGHYINMSSTEYGKVACGYSASGQGLWSNQNFSG